MKYRVGLKLVECLTRNIEAKNREDARRQLRDLAQLNKLNVITTESVTDIIEEIK
jgi:hypothetical protein